MKENMTKDYNQQDTKATFYDLRSADQHNSAFQTSDHENII